MSEANNPNLLDYQPPNVLAGEKSKEFEYRPMGKRPVGRVINQKKRPLSEEAVRLRKIRAFEGYESATEFAGELGFSPTRWSNFENGQPLTRDVAKVLIKKYPWLTYDFLFDGDDSAIPRSKIADFNAFDPDER